jgi:hypothetical protein
MNMSKQKKVLIVSHNSFSLTSNNGKTLTAMFSEWSAENLAQIYFQDEIPESDRLKNFFRVRDLDIIKILMFISRRHCCGNVIDPQPNVKNHYEAAGSFKYWLVGVLRRVEKFKLIIRDIIYGTGLWRSKKLIDWIECFTPDSVFFHSGNSVFSFRIANEISLKLDIPLDVFISDDYVLNAMPKGVIARILHRRLRNNYQSALSRARYVFVIGDDMASAYNAEFCRNFIPAMNAVYFSSSPSRVSFEFKSPGSIDIVYAGALHLGRDQSIVQFGLLAQALSEELDVKIKINVYCIQVPAKHILDRFCECGVVYGGALNQAELASRIKNADFVLHVESFERKYINLTKLSVSTKIPEYLASEICIIAFGPSEVASVRLISNNLVGIVITEKDSLLSSKDKLKSIFNSPEFRRQISVSGFNFGKANFSSDVIGKKIKALLDED